MSKKGVLQPKVREQIEALIREGLGTEEIKARLEAMGHKGIGGQQIGGLLALHRRRTDGDLSAEFRQANETLSSEATSTPAETPGDPPKQPVYPTDGFNWSGGGGGPDKGGFSFGQVKIEYHISRISPSNDGFLGVESEGFTLATLGQKYGSGVYDVVLYINDRRAKSVREIVSKTYGDPKTPRSGTATTPRLVHEEDGKRREPTSSSELSDAVRAVKDIHEMVKQEGPKGGSIQEKVLDKAIEALTKPAAPQDSILAVLQANQQKDEVRWAHEKEERVAREAADRREAAEKHQREMDRMKAEFDYRQKEAERIATEKDKRDEDYRKFVGSLEKDRERRLEDAINATNQSIAGLQAAHAEDLEKERTHQAELAKIRENQLKLDRERMVEEMSLNRKHMDQLYELQIKALPNRGANTEEMICNTIKDVVVRADQKFSETLEVKKMQELIKLVGPENAQQLAASFLLNGGLDLKKVFGQKPAAQPAADGGASPAPTPAGTPTQPQNASPGSVVSKGEGMNSILQQVYETPFFTDLIDIWAGHLRLKRTPYLFVNQMADFMVEDRRVALFYNYMAARTWEEFLEEIKVKIPEKKLPFFQTPEALKFFDEVIELVAKRIELDHVDRGIVPSSIEKAPAEATEK